ncbi:haloacid dehalogenase superfamily protein, subfamily IA, variant 3 with third motif having DD or ED [Mycobacterium sp. JS623]|uniref:HAD family hydrolase n=1 Tax=Mycobacterium sp. JS623 TaxID=212767 RepID=UPI0002A54CBA|nr:HAD family phosphatase [Mycobacterium sp. JS623]AGB22793.1 haloacid dehalogenase superfamily protein, subfamily IA, variant 3 with third motif having DD or ED [Mycobacterium sp. JS623]
MPSTEVIEAWLRSPDPAVVFDFNGTLSDDEHILFDIFRELFRTHLGWAMTAEDYRAELLGRSDREIIERAVTRHGRGTEEEITELLRLRQGVYKQRVAEHNPIGAAAAQLVKLLADNGIPVGIVTGAQRDDVLAVLNGSPAGELISFLIAEEDVNDGKPHPEGFQTAAAKLNREPRDVLVFEDSVPGVQAAVAAGMHCIAVCADEPSADLRAVAPAIVTELSAELVAEPLSRWRRGQPSPIPPAT